MRWTISWNKENIIDVFGNFWHVIKQSLLSNLKKSMYILLLIVLENYIN